VGEVRQAVDAIVDDILQHLSGRPSGWDASRRTGRRNAAAGVPIEDMLLAYHLCAVELWGEYTEAAEGIGGMGRVTGPSGGNRHVATDALKLWDAVERATTAAVTAYRGEEFARSHSERSRRDRMLKTAMGGSAMTTWSQLANACGWRGLGTAAVAIAEPGGLTPFLLEDHLGRHGITSAWFEDAAGSVGFVRVEAEGAGELCRALSKLETGFVAVGPTTSDPDDLPRCYELTRLLSRARGRGDRGVVTFTQDPLGPFVAAAPIAASELVQQTLGGVLGLSAAERDDLLDTLEVFVDASGSTAATADRLFCHRNTVLNRLRRIEEITSFAPNHADDLVRLCLALRALRFLQARAVQ
jgi:hypothetical protein